MQAYVQTDLGETFLDENFVSRQWTRRGILLGEALKRDPYRLSDPFRFPQDMRYLL